MTIQRKGAKIALRSGVVLDKLSPVIRASRLFRGELRLARMGWGSREAPPSI